MPTVCAQASLFAIGLGAGAVPMAAAIQWVLKDGVGHLGAIAYATAVNTRFDADAKRHRFRSGVAATAADAIAGAASPSRGPREGVPPLPSGVSSRWCHPSAQC